MEVPFKEGKITYRLNVILDYIREQLESDYFRTILEEQGVEQCRYLRNKYLYFH